jgi:hypothetical protein
MIASPIFYGVGAGVTGLAYLVFRASNDCTSTSSSTGGYTTTCTPRSGAGALVLYDLITTVTPSVPRWVVGDTTGALIFSGLRGASVLTASLVDWGDGNSDFLGKFIAGFLIPVTLAAVDLATTPHREDLEKADSHLDHTGFTLTGISPVATMDPLHHVNGGTLQVSASF